MKTANDARKTDLVQQIWSRFQTRLGKRQAAVFKAFVEQVFDRVPYQELADSSPEHLAALLAGQTAFMRHRQPGQLSVRVFNPSLDEHGWDGGRSVAELVNDDKPFLVDSAVLALSELGMGIEQVVHPLIRVERDDAGQITRIYPANSEKGQPESVMQLHLDSRVGDSELTKIRDRLADAMDGVHRVVADWKAMEQTVAETVVAMPEWAPGVDAEWMEECQRFVHWLLEDHFVLLGIRDYELVGEGSSTTVRRVRGSGLGILRDESKSPDVRTLDSLAPAARRRSQKRPVIVTKTNTRSTVHRPGYMDYIGVLKIDDQGRTTGERRILGLFTSRAYTQGVMSTPMVRVRARNIMDASGLVQDSHDYKSMMHILQTLPRDDLYQASTPQLREIAEGVLNLQERKLVRLFIRKERYGRFYSCLAYLPRERFNTENREKIQGILAKALKAERIDYNVRVAESSLARLQVLIRPRLGEAIEFDVSALEEEIAAAVRSWTDELGATLAERFGEETGREWLEQFGDAFPEAYKEDVAPWVAAFDVANVSAVAGGEALRMSLYRPREPRGGIIRFKLFRAGRPVPLYDVLPVLENLGLHLVNERPYELKLSKDQSVWIQDFDMQPAQGGEIESEVVRERFQDAFRRTLEGEAENDGFNRLVLNSQMSWRQVAVLRAYAKFLQQANIPFSATYMADSMTRHPGLSRILVELFEALFDPGRDDESQGDRKRARQDLESLLRPIFENECQSDPALGDYLDEFIRARTGRRAGQTEAARNLFERGLQFVASLDEDRILFAFYEVIDATLRTSYFQRSEEGEPREYIAFKIESAALPELPRPRPFREIWVYSPRFEGVHLRGGMIARGGLRWSDRREDFRTEVLGLMKAQNVKNTMIVPVGAKGGFVVKQPPKVGGREAFFEEGVYCYTKFINALLDITDNLDKEIVLPPDAVVRRDGDDPYLVVAADKGTATFSDTANAVAAKHGHWLGDAFASGGSVGYDHKAMGITARGAWEAVKRHFREMGVNTQKEAFTVVGIGDMSGDVFGNGMLLSRHIRLKAAFNHVHIFLDPNPDEKTSYAERRRLFRKPRSSWMDYDRGLISRGGGVFSRNEKTVPVSREVAQWLGIEAQEIAPNDLIKALLTSEVDLLWNGGIGTYVKASTESHADVGDLSNNAVRVDGRELRCKSVGEGGNLGMTQLGRIEYAQNGGRVNTDFIDNSAGVDTSDHEVNIKILLNQVREDGKLDSKARKALLADMSDEVAGQVLRNTYLQTQAISVMKAFSPVRMGTLGHFINVLEDLGQLDRGLEYLPSEEELAERRERGEGMTRPELAVLLSYSKITLYQQLLDSDVPEDAWLSDEAVDYFPEPIREQYAPYVKSHRLKREIIATQVTNSLVNRMGASFVMRMKEDTGADSGEVARAYTIAREVFAARDFWRAVERLDNRVDSALQVEALLTMWELLRQSGRWLLNLPGRELDIGRRVRRLAPGVRAMEKTVRDNLDEEARADLKACAERFVEGGFSRKLAARVALLRHLFPALDVVETAARRRTDVERVARITFALGKQVELDWIRRHIEALEVKGPWHAMSRASLRDELLHNHNLLVQQVLVAHGRKKNPVGAWLDAHGARVHELRTMLTRMKNQGEMDFATLSVAVRALGQAAEEPAVEDAK
ncbi:MAG: NAD-glutamate dehydrogenase [Xanthomonadales bacterium]|nr:NAD-glutamate dehydrogenase [Gammaproteobacteria bacterium]NNL05004.1 NAD-glutamate dehydrogenase [Xanthomonadales bacterium]